MFLFFFGFHQKQMLDFQLDRSNDDNYVEDRKGQCLLWHHMFFCCCFFKSCNNTLSRKSGNSNFFFLKCFILCLFSEVLFATHKIQKKSILICVWHSVAPYWLPSSGLASIIQGQEQVWIGFDSSACLAKLSDVDWCFTMGTATKKKLKIK